MPSGSYGRYPPAVMLSLGHSLPMVPNGAAGYLLFVTMPLRSVNYSALRSRWLKAAITPIKRQRVSLNSSNSADFAASGEGRSVRVNDISIFGVEWPQLSTPLGPAIADVIPRANAGSRAMLLARPSCPMMAATMISDRSAPVPNGQTLHFGDVRAVSAFHPIATKSRTPRHFGFGPDSAARTCSKSGSGSGQ